MGSGPARLLVVLWALLLAIHPELARAEDSRSEPPARAQDSGVRDPAPAPAEPPAPLPPIPDTLRGKNIERIEVVFEPPRWATRVQVRRVRPGQIFTA